MTGPAVFGSVYSPRSAPRPRGKLCSDLTNDGREAGAVCEHPARRPATSLSGDSGTGSATRQPHSCSSTPNYLEPFSRFSGLFLVESPRGPAAEAFEWSTYDLADHYLGGANLRPWLGTGYGLESCCGPFSGRSNSGPGKGRAYGGREISGLNYR